MLQLRIAKIESKKKIKDMKTLELIRNKQINRVNEEVSHMERKIDYDKHKFGVWRKDDDTSTWHFINENTLDMRLESIIPASKKLMKSLHDKNNYDIFNERWKEHTHGNSNIEIDWSKKDIFDISHMDNNNSNNNKINLNVNLITNNDDINDEDLEYKNEYDNELIDENIDDIMDILKI